MKYQCEEVLNFMELKYRASMHASYAYASSFFDNRACVELDMMFVSDVRVQSETSIYLGELAMR